MEKHIQKSSNSTADIGQIGLMKPLIAYGANSKTYLLDDKRVAKVYDDPEIDLPLLRKYQELVGVAAESVKDRSFNDQIILADVKYTYGFSVIPIDEVHQEAGKVMAVSPYVPGPHLLALSSPTQLFEQQIESLSDQEKIDRLTEIHGAITSDAETYVPEVYKILAVTTDKLQSIPGGKGIHLSVENVKVDINPKKNHLTFIITDLATDLTYLKE